MNMFNGLYSVLPAVKPYLDSCCTSCYMLVFPVVCHYFLFCHVLPTYYGAVVPVLLYISCYVLVLPVVCWYFLLCAGTSYCILVLPICCYVELLWLIGEVFCLTFSNLWELVWV